MKKWVRVAILAGLVVGVGGVGFFGYFEAMKRGWVRYDQFDIRNEGILRVGDPAPDLSFERVGGDGPVKLSSLYQNLPLVIVFGSYT